MVIPHTDSITRLIWWDVTQNQALITKEVSAYISWYRVHTWGLQGKCHKLFSVNFCVNLQILYM